MKREQVCCVAPVSTLIKPLIPSWRPTITSLNHNYLQKGPHPNTVRCDFGDEPSKTRTLGRHIETIVCQDEIMSLPHWKPPSESQRQLEDSPSSFLWHRWLNQIWPLSLALDQVGSSLDKFFCPPLVNFSSQASLFAFLLIELWVTVCTLRSQAQPLEKPNKTYT